MQQRSLVGRQSWFHSLIPPCRGEGDEGVGLRRGVVRSGMADRGVMYDSRFRAVSRPITSASPTITPISEASKPNTPAPFEVN